MKNRLIIIPVIIFILLFASAQIYSQNDLTKSFHKSITDETNKNYSKAIEEMLKLYSTHKGDYLINLRLGWLYYLDGDYQKSKSFYANALSIKNSVEANLGLTLPLSALGEWSRIKEIYQNILKTDADNYTANLRLGQILLNSSDYQNAKKYLEKAYNQYPSEYEPNLSLGYTYYYLGDKTKAKSLLTAAALINPADTQAKEGLKLIK